MKSRNNIFKIFGAYQWSVIKSERKAVKNINSVFALKELLKQVENRVEKILLDSDIKLRYNRLRATAGSFVLDGIRDRITNSNAVIFDITDFNPNVMFELGIAMEASRITGRAKVYIICAGENFKERQIPSDLNGYFISFYEIKNDKVVFHDNNSLAMQLVSDMIAISDKGFIETED